MQLTIQLSGVAAIGPGWPRKKKKGPVKVRGPLYAIMPASTRRRNAWSLNHTAQPPAYLPVHFPTVLTKSKDWDVLQRTPDVVPVDANVNGWSIWFPRRERLEIIVDDDTGPGDIIFEHAWDAGDDGKPEGDVHHVADMRRVWPARAKLRRGVRPGASVQLPVDDVVAAHVLISKGYVKSAFRAPDPWTAVFDPCHTSDAEPLVQTLAPHLLVTRDVKRSVEIRSWSLDTGEQLDSIVFQPKSDLSVFVGNTDPADLFEMVGTKGMRIRETQSDYSRDGQRDYDFELYYDLLQGRKTTSLSVPVNIDSHVGYIRNCYLAFVED